MLKIQLGVGREQGLSILCIGAHSDDIEIGCGGTLLRLTEEYPRSTFHWVVMSAIGVRKAEAQRGAEAFVGAERLKQVHLKEFRDGFMPFAGVDVKCAFEALKESISPDLIFTHNSRDAHQDHRLLSELTWNTFRDHCILEYEIPKYDGDLGRPNVFVPLQPDIYQAKVSRILNIFQSQRSKRWFEESTFLSLMRLRGMECNSFSGYAEAFYGRKLTI